MKRFISVILVSIIALSICFVSVTADTQAAGTSYTYNESWQEFQVAHLATESSFGARDLIDGYSTFSGAPFIRFSFSNNLENYSVHIADLNVIMFDSESTYNSVKDVSTLKSLSFNGTAQINLTNISDITNAIIEFTATDECTYDSIYQYEITVLYPQKTKSQSIKALGFCLIYVIVQGIPSSKPHILQLFLLLSFLQKFEVTVLYR